MRRLTEPLGEFTEIYLDDGHSVTLTGRFSLEANQKVCSRVSIGACPRVKGQSARSKIFVSQLTTVNISQKIPFDPKMGSLAPFVRALEFNQ